MDSHLQQHSWARAPSWSQTNAPSRKVLVAGASGLVGHSILQGLLDDPSVGEVHVLARRDLLVRHPKLTVHQVDFARIPPLPAIDEVYLALGTTLRQAGGRAAFRAVDFDANLAVAKAALLAGAQRIGLVSAYRADPNSSYFYTRVKGELEQALRLLLPQSLVIARPSFLLGDRTTLRQPPRPGEKIGIWLSKLLSPVVPTNYRPVEAQCVANALLATVRQCQGSMILLPQDLQHFY